MEANTFQNMVGRIERKRIDAFNTSEAFRALDGEEIAKHLDVFGVNTPELIEMHFRFFRK